jgi:Heterokaryon incompatibility protein (HET)
MGTYSLRDLRHEYKKYESTSGSGTCNRQSLSAWSNKTSPLGQGKVISKDQQHYVPRPESYRFNWGDYATLSYTWGDQNDKRTILLNGVEIQITANLEAALRALSENPDFEDGYKIWSMRSALIRKILKSVENKLQK